MLGVEPGLVSLGLRGDRSAEPRGWFAFRVVGDEPAELRIVDADSATYAGTFDSYEAMVSFDGGPYERAPTIFEGGALSIAHEPRGFVARYAYFAPYSTHRLERLLTRLAGRAQVSSLGESVSGRPIWCAELGNADAARAVWIIARQHPGESPATWAAEGVLRRLASRRGSIAELLADTRVFVVPIANPDGVAQGNHRTNALGVDLNRAWAEPSEASEVSALLRALDDRPPALFLDMHADESAAHAFASRCEGNPSYEPALAAREEALCEALAVRSPDFTTEPFYELDAPGEADLSCAANQVGERYGCPALTLELPFKGGGDEVAAPGWGPRRSVALGAALASSLVHALG